LRNFFFTEVCSNRTRGNSFKLKEGTFRLELRKKFFMMREGSRTLEKIAQRRMPHH